jgi:carbon-monoxide dehydrogenase medium subunit
MYAFDYHRPPSLADAASKLKTGSARVLAGGQTLIPAMKFRLAQADNVVDLGAIEDLKGITQSGSSLRIGAMTTHATVAESPVVKQAIPGLAALATQIGDPHVRNRGTIGGSVANNDPAADYPAAVLALGATVNTNQRAMAADDFFTGLFSTALEDSEIITHFDFPVPESFAYMKFANPASRFALVGVAVARTTSGVRVAVTGAGASGVYRLKEAESALGTNFSAAALDGVKIDATNLLSDIHAEADYRAHLVGVMLRRAVG